MVDVAPAAVAVVVRVVDCAEGAGCP